MKEAASEADIQIIAGDTKVVEKGKADGLFISTTGVGWLSPQYTITGSGAKPGDIVFISGSIGEHGVAVLEARGELGFETHIQSDVAPLNHLIRALLEAAPHTHVLRDPTRGGLATTLNEIAIQSNVCIELEEDTIPVQPAVLAACEMLGFDPLYIANEGKIIAIIPPEEAEDARLAMRSSKYGTLASRIGIVRETPKKARLVENHHWRHPRPGYAYR